VYGSEDILNVLKLTLLEWKVLEVLITLTPRRRIEFIDCQKENVCIAVLPTMDVKTHWNSTLELLQ